MKKRKSTRRARVGAVNTKDAGELLIKGVLPGAVGAVVLQKLAERFLPAEYQQYTNYAVGAGGLLLALAMKNPMAKAAGLGTAIVAGSKIVGDLADGQVNGIGLLPPGVPSVRIADGYRGRWSPLNGTPDSDGGVIRQ